MRTTLLRGAPAAALLVLSSFVCAPAFAQATGVAMPGFKGQPIYEAPITGDDTRQAVVALFEFAPGGTNPRHTHFGECIGTVTEGAVEVRVDGQAPFTVPAGKAYHVPRGQVHELHNPTPATTRMVVTFVVDKGKPVRVPAP